MNSTAKAMGIDYSEIAELNAWLDSLLRQAEPADPLTLCNIHRQLVKYHSAAAEAALGQVSLDVNPTPVDGDS